MGVWSKKQWFSICIWRTQGPVLPPQHHLPPSGWLQITGLPSREGSPKFQTSLCPEKGLQSPRHPALLPSWILISSPSHVPDQRPSNIRFQQDLQIHSAHSWHPPPSPCHHGNLLSQPAAPSAGIYSSLPIGLLAALLPPAYSHAAAEGSLRKKTHS